MAKAKKDTTEIVTVTIKNIHGDTVQQTQWRKKGSDWSSDRGVMTETEFNDELKRMEKRDDVTITKDTIEL